MPKEVLVGFDAREPIQQAGFQWDLASRARYLVCPDAPLPISVDGHVWKSVFSPEVPRSPVPEEWGRNSHLWRDKTAIMQAVDDAGLRKPQSEEPPAHVVIAVSAVFDSRRGVAWDPQCWIPCEPSKIEASWRLLGYDIIEEYGTISGLSGCGYDGDSVPQLRKRWGQHLNGFHLFKKRRVALRFCEVTNERVPEHAPFLPYGIWVVE